jgi:catechol 2,3-dioxygenase-like lactoylglutathione lyase family enzyme
MRENDKKPLFRKVDCIRIPVTDLQDGLKFYRDELGHELIWRNFRIGKCAVVKDPWENQYILLDTSKGLLKTDSNKNVINSISD